MGWLDEMGERWRWVSYFANVVRHFDMTNALGGLD